jgi:hypothetical protein
MEIFKGKYMPKHEIDLPEIPGYKFKRIGIPTSYDEYMLIKDLGKGPEVRRYDSSFGYSEERVIYEKKEPLKIGIDAGKFYLMDKLLEYKPKKVLLARDTNQGRIYNIAYFDNDKTYIYAGGSEPLGVNYPYWHGFYVIEN